MVLTEGSLAPTFSLKNQDGQVVALKDLLGKKTVLYFYPKDMTPGCTQESCDFNESLGRVKQKGARVFGISFDSATSHKKFIQKHELEFDLLVDDTKELATAFGVYQKKKFLGKEYMGIVRSTFIINESGRISKVFSPVSVKGHVAEVLAFL